MRAVQRDVVYVLLSPARAKMGRYGLIWLNLRLPAALAACCTLLVLPPTSVCQLARQTSQIVDPADLSTTADDLSPLAPNFDLPDRDFSFIQDLEQEAPSDEAAHVSGEGASGDAEKRTIIVQEAGQDTRAIATEAAEVPSQYVLVVTVSNPSKLPANQSLSARLKSGFAAALGVAESNVHVINKTGNHAIKMWMTDEDQRPLSATDIIALLDVDLLSFYLSDLQVESILPQNSYLRSSYHRGLWEGNYLPFMVAAAAAVLACIVVTMVYFYGKRNKPTKKGQPDLDQMCVYPGVKPVVKTTKVIQPDSPKLTPSSSISASPSPSPAYRGSPKAGKPKGLQERRGSNVSLSIDLPMPPLSADSVKCGTPPKESIVDELLQSGTRKMTRAELRQSILNAKALYGEFWEIPMNHPEQVEIPGCGTKNRYKTILPNAHSRVVLPEVDNDLLTTYINANYVKGYDMEERSYIATQGPMNHTVTDFWQMVWQERTPIIVMITKLTEKNEKCAHYWPDLEDRYGDIVVSVNRVVEHDGYILRHFTLQRGNEVHYIRHYWCTEWPDHKTPETAKALLALVQEVEFHRLRQTRPRRPVVVHCSAGIGRTGCFIATSIGIRQLREENTVDVLSIVCGMRQDRGGMVQTNEQYEFIHYALCQFEKTLPSEGVD
ncbi:receptor-type tyrosine-protein phosphatase R-like [Branchiostoma floridae]|uniref:protein-tyrosine-phosphatase n=1 Tax=Branchiostoma floridae TaxID=7739 RepID=A0A9J7MPX3_BRAFL|nr:receptor-type tyrosine-protein phosphatase R-like [Branchiostoma floridae]